MYSGIDEHTVRLVNIYMYSGIDEHTVRLVNIYMYMTRVKHMPVLFTYIFEPIEVCIKLNHWSISVLCER